MDKLTSFEDTLEDFGSKLGDIGGRIVMEEGIELGLEEGVVALSDVRECIEEHELGSKLGKGVLEGDELEVGADGVKIGVEVSEVGDLVKGVLDGVHVADVVEVVGVVDGNGVRGVGEFVNEELFVVKRELVVTQSKCKEEKAVEAVKPELVIGESEEEFLKGLKCEG